MEYTEDHFYQLYKNKADEQLIEAVLKPQDFQHVAVLAATKILKERNIDIDALKTEQQQKEENTLNDYKQEIYDRFARGESVDSVRLVMNETYDHHEMLDKEIEADEELKAKREIAWKPILIAGAILLAILRIMRHMH